MNPQTRLYISVSAKPGIFGTTIFSALFKKYKINAVYLPRLAPNAKDLANAIRALNISGCAISMPLKEAILQELDLRDSSVDATGSCNTILQRESRLAGFNTDIFGCQEALRGLPIKSALVYGAGGVVPSVVAALRSLGVEKICLLARSAEAAQQRIKKHSLSQYSEDIEFDLLVNCTPASMDEKNTGLFSLIPQCKSIMDLVTAPKPTALIQQSIKLNKHTIPGWRMSMFQLQKQFLIYENIEPSETELMSFIQDLYLDNS